MFFQREQIIRIIIKINFRQHLLLLLLLYAHHLFLRYGGVISMARHRKRCRI